MPSLCSHCAGASRRSGTLIGRVLYPAQHSLLLHPSTREMTEEIIMEENISSKVQHRPAAALSCAGAVLFLWLRSHPSQTRRESFLHPAPSYAQPQPHPVQKGQRFYFGFDFQIFFCLPQSIKMPEPVLAWCTQFYSNLDPGRELLSPLALVLMLLHFYRCQLSRRNRAQKE